jgi:hypothetical protein
MRFLLPDPLGNDKHSQMFHTSGFAIAAGVVAVGAAAGSAAISMSAADRAKKAQGAAAGRFKKQQRKAVKGYEKGQQQVQGMIADVQAPVYDFAAMRADAEQDSEYQRQQLEKFLPGAAAQRERQMQIVNQVMEVLAQNARGEYGEDVTQKTMRDVAQYAGAGFNPATAGQAGGFQAAQGLAARQLGQTTLDVQRGAFEAMPRIASIGQSWSQIAKGFMANTQDFGRLRLGYQTAGAEVGLQKARMTGDMYNNIFNAQSGLATQIYGANKENAAASYAAQQAVGQGVSDIGQATSGAFTGMSYASAAQQGLGGGMGGYANNPYASYPLYNTPSSSSGVYYGGKPATGSMSDRPYAIPT